jgi:alpha-beta hydrolase superfamily lysophospholipase
VLRRLDWTFPAPPVLLGRSMGGLVVQGVLERYRAAPAAVLLASAPPGHGLAVPR